MHSCCHPYCWKRLTLRCTVQTCQTIAFLSWLKHKNQESQSSSRHPHLVIAPASVVSNWEIEFQKFAPNLNVVKYHGSMNERLDVQERLRKYLPGSQRGSDQLDVIIAPVTYFQQEKSDDRYFLKKFQYDYMIVDEAHLLKNSRGMRYKSLDRFKTLHRLLLTVSIVHGPHVSFHSPDISSPSPFDYFETIRERRSRIVQKN